MGVKISNPYSYKYYVLQQNFLITPGGGPHTMFFYLNLDAGESY